MSKGALVGIGLVGAGLAAAAIFMKAQAAKVSLVSWMYQGQEMPQPVEVGIHTETYIGDTVAFTATWKNDEEQQKAVDLRLDMAMEGMAPYSETIYASTALPGAQATVSFQAIGLSIGGTATVSLSLIDGGEVIDSRQTELVVKVEPVITVDHVVMQVAGT